jgi:hypothetical protein
MRLPIALLTLSVLSSNAFAGGADIAIVVNKANKIETVSSKDLKQMFAGEKTRWPDGGKVQTLAPDAATPEHKTAILFLFGLSEADYQKYCLHASFVGEQQKVPRDSGTSSAVLNLVSLIPGAVSFVRASAVTPGVKILRIDGIAPGEPGYPLTEK